MPAHAGFDERRAHLDPGRMRRAPNVLALSGGGEDRAFGAGVLTGWSETGTRPEFDIVTGISTGAIVAPFAFLVSAYDPELRRIYTARGADDILRYRGITGVWSDALASSAPMKRLIARHLPDAVLRQMAREWRGGRRLFVVTSNLDSGRAVIWDMGAIAEAGRFDLFRDAISRQPRFQAFSAGQDPNRRWQRGACRRRRSYSVSGRAGGGVRQPGKGQWQGRCALCSGWQHARAAHVAVARQSVPIMQQPFGTMVVHRRLNRWELPRAMQRGPACVLRWR